MPGVSKLICKSLIEKKKWIDALCYGCAVRNKSKCENKKLIKGE